MSENPQQAAKPVQNKKSLGPKSYYDHCGHPRLKCHCYVYCTGW